MKKILATIMILSVLALASCTEAEKVSYNVSQEADSFNVLRRFAVIDTRTDKVEFELIGRFSLDATSYPKVSVIVEKEKGVYLKHIIGLNDDTFYIVEDIGGAEVNEYRYEINYIPEMIKPFEFKSKD